MTLFDLLRPCPAPPVNLASRLAGHSDTKSDGLRAGVVSLCSRSRRRSAVRGGRRSAVGGGGVTGAVSAPDPVVPHVPGNQVCRASRPDRAAAPLTWGGGTATGLQVIGSAAGGPLTPINKWAPLGTNWTGVRGQKLRLMVGI